MSPGYPIRCYDFVDRPYPRVREALTRDAVAVFQQATRAAASRAHSVAAALHVKIGILDVTTEIDIEVTRVEDRSGTDTEPPRTVLHLEWAATHRPHLFPLMRAELALYPLTGRETQLDFSGTYLPPLGMLGEAIHALGGHRIADASVHRFLGDVAEYLRTRLPPD
ncbi:MAG: hypothetical protein KDC87_10780 [Planctomycetes bacterium]|nr:hypothetical protein [Planctomycetota bacterium]MCB9870107.1 hypothetical protein [Planctomycetota bacterium]